MKKTLNTKILIWHSFYLYPKIHSFHSSFQRLCQITAPICWALVHKYWKQSRFFSSIRENGLILNCMRYFRVVKYLVDKYYGEHYKEYPVTTYMELASVSFSTKTCSKCREEKNNPMILRSHNELWRG